MPQRLLARSLRFCWFALLLLPNVTTLALANAWETKRALLALASLWLVATSFAFLPRKAFLVVTAPLIVLGAIVVGADVDRSANLFELLAVWHTFRAAEIVDAMRPYVVPIAAYVIAVLVLMVVLWRIDNEAALLRGWRLRSGLAAGGVALAFMIPAHAWLEAWPLDVLPALAATETFDVAAQLSPLTSMRVSPRDRHRSWQASRRTATVPPAETYVFVIGETVRSDRVKGCGGRPQLTPPPAGALLYCDVLAGSANSHTAVPLLISRELPGRQERISNDSTFLHAFEEAGFDTYWLAVQEKTIAWPDARNQSFDLEPGLDRDLLVPRLDQALAKPEPRKMIVLHAYNAHSPYVERYSQKTAPFAVDAAKADSDDAQRWNAYDNAVDESMRFLDEVVARVRTRTEPVFLVYTSDHGENLGDDARRLQNHALKFPTLWDTKVPLVIWANEAWRRDHAGQWALLEANQPRSLMHMDIVPTLLGAAGVAYAEPRKQPVDLTARIAPARLRFTELRAGQTVALDTLYREAGRRMPPAPAP